MNRTGLNRSTEGRPVWQGAPVKMNWVLRLELQVFELFFQFKEKCHRNIWVESEIFLLSVLVLLIFVIKSGAASSSHFFGDIKSDSVNFNLNCWVSSAEKTVRQLQDFETKFQWDIMSQDSLISSSVLWALNYESYTISANTWYSHDFLSYGFFKVRFFVISRRVN